MKKTLMLLITALFAVGMLFAEDHYTHMIVIRSVVEEVAPIYSLEVESYKNLEVERRNNTYILINTDLDAPSSANLSIKQHNTSKYSDNVELIVRVAGCSISNVECVCMQCVLDNIEADNASFTVIHNGCTLVEHTVATFNVDVTARVAYVQLTYAAF